jgi:hypothetical protein
VIPAPGANVTAPEPSAASLPSIKEPALEVTPPEKVFDPLKVSTAVPVLTNPPVPLTTPLKVESTVEPDVRLKPCKFKDPAPLNAPIVSEAFSLNVAPD